MGRYFGSGILFAALTGLVSAPAHAQNAPAAEPSLAQAPSAATPAKPDVARFEKLRVGMYSSEVNEVLGRAPDDYHTYESGKRWIPFYFGKDAVRLQALYKGEGCLIFSVGFRYQNHGTEWKDVEGTLLEIAPDASGKCYQP